MTQMEPILFCKRDRAAYGWLSNFYPAPIRMKRPSTGVVTEWPTVEHYYQAQKYRGTARERTIQRAPSAKIARELGQATGVRRDWDLVKDRVMLAALRAKFRPGSDLAAALIATGEVALVEDAWWDGYWGTGRDGTGRNRLGELLMQVRAELAEALERALEEENALIDRLEREHERGALGPDLEAALTGRPAKGEQDLDQRRRAAR